MNVYLNVSWYPFIIVFLGHPTDGPGNIEHSFKKRQADGKFGTLF